MNTQVGRLETASRKNAGTPCSPYLRNGVGIAIVMALALTYPQYAAAQSRNTTGGQTTPAGTDKTGVPQQEGVAESNDGQAATSDRSPTELGTITVTANKRSERLQDVPMAISVLGNLRLDRENAVGFSDYASQVPGLNIITSGQGQTQLVVRGITSGSDQNNASVATYINNAPFGSSTIYAFGSLLTPDIDPSELQSIEVLKGPQGTLYGSNSLGGLIKFVTTPPDTTQFSGRVNASGSTVAGSDTTGWRTHAMVNLPLAADTLALRVNAYDRTDPGYIDNVVSGQSEVNEAKVSGGRMQLLWTPSDTVSVNLSALLHNLDGEGLGNGGVDVDPATLQPMYGANRHMRAAGTGRSDLKFRLYDLSVDADFGWAKLISTTSYSTQRGSLNQDQTALYASTLDPLLGLSGIGYSVTVDLALDKVAQEIRLQSPEDQAWEWRVGMFYTREHSTMEQNLFTSVYATGDPVVLPVTLLHADIGPATFREWAAYGDLTWHANEHLSIRVGARYSNDETDYTQSGDGLLLGGPSTFNTRGSDQPVTYLFNPSYKFSDNVMAYVRVASGFRPGGANIGVPPGLGAPQTFGPDKLVNYELGLKWLMPDHHMRINADVFHIDWTSMQLTVTKGGLSFMGNGGKASSQGAELSWRYNPVGGLVFWANSAYTEATLAANTPSGSIIGYKGDTVPYVPKWSANIGGDYDFQLGSGGWTGFVGGNISYIGERYSDFNTVPAPRIRLPSYNIINLHMGVNYRDWTFEAFVKNLANKHGISSISPETMNPVGGPFQATYQTPRTIGVSASVYF